MQRRDALLCTGFLTPAEQAQALAWVREYPNARFSGGYEEAERRVLLLLPSYLEEEAAQQEALGAMLVQTPFSHGLTHRDYLGALLGLGIKRECLGDILVQEQSAVVIALSRMLPFLQEHLSEVGRFAAHPQALELSDIPLPEKRVKTVRCTVPQLRLDCVAAAAFSLSRSRISEAIAQGAVSLNHAPCLQRDRTVAQGDAISVRGLGKAHVTQIGGRSKKDRLWVELERLC